MAEIQQVGSSHVLDKETMDIRVDEKRDSESIGELTSALSQWEPGKLKRFPWGGFGALITIIACSTAGLLVLRFAEYRLASTWPQWIAPNVCLSILNGLSTLAIAYAVAQGVAIAWWRKAMLGTSIKELHYGWAFSASVSSILVKYKYFNAIALAALAAKVAIVDGVLYQRALSSTVVEDWNPTNVTVQAWSMDRFPITGHMGQTEGTDGHITSQFPIDLQTWVDTGVSAISDSSPMRFRYCYSSYCYIGLPAAGFGVDCNTTVTTNDFFNSALRNSSLNSTAPLSLFRVDFDLLYPSTGKNYSRIQMNATWPVPKFDPSDSSNILAPTSWNNAICEFRPALVNYTVEYRNASSVERGKEFAKDRDGHLMSSDTGSGSGFLPTWQCDTYGIWDQSALEGDDSNYDPYYGYVGPCRRWNSSWHQLEGMKVTLDPKYDVYEPYQPGGNSTLLGFYHTLQNYFATSAVITRANNRFYLTENGTFASQALNSSLPGHANANYTYRDPRSVITQQLNTMSLIVATDRYGYDSDRGFVDATKQNIPKYTHSIYSQGYYKDRMYLIDEAYMWAAFGLTYLVVLLIIPSYWGYWQLGRDVTLGPMEIAYAFQGPAFANVHDVNGNADQVVKKVGRTKIQYGAVGDGVVRKLAFKSAEA